MFNPQRKSKLADIYMEERAFQLHLQKMRKIQKSSSPNSRHEQQNSQLKYLQRLQNSKKEVQDRLSSNLSKENHRLFRKLMQTDARPQEITEQSLPAKKEHFNSHFYNKKMTEKIRSDNFGIINRMLNQTSMVPPLDALKKDFKQNKRYSKLVRKLPAIIKNEERIKRDLSMNKLNLSKTSSHSSRVYLASERASTQMMNHMENIENDLIKKE